MKKKKRVELKSVREKKFVKNIVQCGGIGKSAVLAGYSDPSYGTRLLQVERVKGAVLQALEDAGLGDRYLATKLKEGCEAVYPIKKSSSGSVIQDNDPDYFVRSIYLDKVLKVRGDYAPEQHEVTEKKIIVMITPGFMKGLIDTEVLSLDEVKELKALPEHMKEIDGDKS